MILKLIIFIITLQNALIREDANKSLLIYNVRQAVESRIKSNDRSRVSEIISDNSYAIGEQCHDCAAPQSSQLDRHIWSGQGEHGGFH